MIKFKFHLINEWPPLAWAAECSKSNSVIFVYHGNHVEVSDNWFCEAVWDGDYESGAFDTTDIVFGSGARIRGENVIFVSSASTLDRLQFLENGEKVWISNSLACLLEINNIKLKITDTSYFKFFGSIAKGLKNYERELDTLNGKVYVSYYSNLKWNGESCVEVEKPDEIRDFSTFEKYQNFLLKKLHAIMDNMSSTGRKFSYTFLGTLSSGYDSTANTVLAHQVGMQEAMSFLKARGGASDDGREIASKLGIKLTLIPRHNWRSLRFAEVPFIVSDAKGEDIYYSSAGDLLNGKVLLTGFHGDKVWAKENYKLDATIYRGDRSGLSLTEYRLLKGFIHFPVPFMGVRQIQDINKISNSDEMKPWDIPGDYSRPICRRIVEEAGVPRNSFGILKKAASVLFGSRGDVLSDATRKDIYEWLLSNADAWSKEGKVSPHKKIRFVQRINPSLRIFKKGLRIMIKIIPTPAKSYIHRLEKKLRRVDLDVLLLKHAFPWAIEKEKEKYNAYQKINIDRYKDEIEVKT